MSRPLEANVARSSRVETEGRKIRLPKFHFSFLYSRFDLLSMQTILEVDER